MFKINFRKIGGVKTPKNSDRFAKLRQADLLYTEKKDTSLSYTKEDVLNAIEDNNIEELRKISNYFFGVSGIYQRLVYHLSTLYTYDNVITPVKLDTGVPVDKVKKAYNSTIIYKRRFNLKKNFAAIALNVIKDGVFYGYLREGDKSHVMQVLPTKYCQSIYEYAGMPVIDFDVKYFDSEFRSDIVLRDNVLKAFPKEIRSGYNKYKSGSLKPDKKGKVWVQLDYNYATMFRMTEDERPFFVSVIPDIIDLAERKDAENQKDEQELYKMVIQKMPIKKDGELVFDLDEAAEMHQNAVSMLEDAPGLDVLTTFADVDMLNLQDKNRITSDNLGKAFNTVYSEAGSSKMVFSTDGNLSLKDSLINDEALMSVLIDQFQKWFSFRLNALFARNPKKMFISFDILPVTRHNRPDKIKEYKDLASFGYPKLLPIVASGLPQETFVGMIGFENDILGLNETMIPLQSSHTQGDDDEGGAPEKEDNQKADKTLKNEDNKEKEKGGAKSEDSK